MLGYMRATRSSQKHFDDSSGRISGPPSKNRSDSQNDFAQLPQEVTFEIIGAALHASASYAALSGVNVAFHNMTLDHAMTVLKIK